MFWCLAGTFSLSSAMLLVLAPAAEGGLLLELGRSLPNTSAAVRPDGSFLVSSPEGVSMAGELAWDWGRSSGILARPAVLVIPGFEDDM